MKKSETIFQRWILIFTMIIASFFVTGISSAFNRDDLEKIKATKSCQGCDLRGAGLSGADLSNVNLSGADLTGANLRNTKLPGANLSGAKLINAVLSNANLSGANLTNANLGGAYMSGTDFSGARWTDGTTCKPGSVGKCRK